MCSNRHIIGLCYVYGFIWCVSFSCVDIKYSTVRRKEKKVQRILKLLLEQRGVKINNHIINNTTAIIINKSNWLVKFNEYFTLPIYSNRNRNKPQQKSRAIIRVRFNYARNGWKKFQFQLKEQSIVVVQVYNFGVRSTSNSPVCALYCCSIC